MSNNRTRFIAKGREQTTKKSAGEGPARLTARVRFGGAVLPWGAMRIAKPGGVGRLVDR
jgi:hypothetical protein